MDLYSTCENYDIMMTSRGLLYMSESVQFSEHCDDGGWARDRASEIMMMTGWAREAFPSRTWKRQPES